MPPTQYQDNAPHHYEPADPQRLEARFAQRLDVLRGELANADPAMIATQSGAIYTPAGTRTRPGDCLRLPLWSRLISINCSDWVAYPDGEDQPLSPFDQTLLLYYLTTADGTPLTDEWIAFSDLPDGRFYNQAFQGYSGAELQRSLPGGITAFEQAAQALGGVRKPLGNQAFAFQALPRVPLLVVYWQGDEDFPSTYQVLFNSAASHYLPTDAYAILGGTLTRRLINARNVLTK